MKSFVLMLRDVKIHAASRAIAISENLGNNNLWKRIVKNVAATTIAVSVCLIPSSKTAIGRAAYLSAITTVFGHPGRRFGQVVETLILILCGTLLGLVWSILGTYFASLVIKNDPAAAYAIKGIFLSVALIIHGFFRSKTPRLFVFVLLLIIVTIVTLTSTSTVVKSVSVTQILYPILLGTGANLLVNLCVFPEFSSSFLGKTTIDTLHETTSALDKAGDYFIGLQKKKNPSESGFHRPHKQEEEAQNDNRHFLYLIHRMIASLVFKPKDQPTKGNTSTGQAVSLPDLTSSKAKLRTRLGNCKAAQSECNFELAFGVLPPENLKPISARSMKRLVANTIAVIGACESKFALVGDEDAGEVDLEKSNRDYQSRDSKDLHTGAYTYLQPQLVKSSAPAISKPHSQRTDIDLIKPKREIEFADIRLLQDLLNRIEKPYKEFMASIKQTVACITISIACSYDVPTLPSGARKPQGIPVEEIDVYIDEFKKAMINFDLDVMSALEGVNTGQEMEGQEPDIMPREEIFLISSFLLNIRQASTHLEDMLKTSRNLVLRRQERHARRRLYAPHIQWSKWLYSGGEEEESTPANARKEHRQRVRSEQSSNDAKANFAKSDDSFLTSQRAKDVENDAGLRAETGENPSPQNDLRSKKPNEGKKSRQGQPSLSLQLRGKTADIVEWAQTSDDLLYAFKLAFGVILVTWPAFVAKWNSWYSLNRGVWAALQLIFITEVSIGTSMMTFFLRGIGTTLGCLWGWAAIEARAGNRVVAAVMICIGLFPWVYLQLGTQYPKAGMVAIVSMCVVTLATEIETVPGSATENFLKRWIAFLIGGTIAIVVEMVLVPVKARTRLVESLAASLRQVVDMETCIASGVEESKNLNVYDTSVIKRFERASAKAKGALSAAETFLPFCDKEPRIKGSFDELSNIYSEILFVLHQITERMDNMLQLRTAYGSGPLEELNAQVYPYRRNVAGSIILTLSAVHGALIHKLPLPQFLPSARLAHLRMVNRVREAVQENIDQGEYQHEAGELTRHRLVRRKYMSWNASCAAQAEVIEYLEELIDLTKLLVGANEFRSGLLVRPTYLEYAKMIFQENINGEKEPAVDADGAHESRDAFNEPPTQISGMTRRRRGTTLKSAGSEGNELPTSLRRIQSRKIEAGITRQATRDGWYR